MTASTAGSYAVTITGTNGTLVHSTKVAVTVVPPGPTARFTFYPPFPVVNQQVVFDASSSTDTDPGATLEARWDWEGNGTWDTGYSTTLTAQHAFSAPGAYPVRLEIRDSHSLLAQETHTVRVSERDDDEVGAPPGYGLTDPTKLEARGPIDIVGNGNFTAANGVRSGTGAAGDPYVIRDWFIDASLYTWAQAMIHIESTDAYVVIENNKIVNLTDSNHWEGIQLGHWPAILTTSHVTIRNNHIENARHAYGIAVREGSSDVFVAANYVQTDATLDDVFGIATDRNVHDVTIYGNYVNAYTGGTFRTSGIHIGDTHGETPIDALRATNVVARRNTVVNATAGAIVSLISTGTRIDSNRVSMEYPGPKSVGPDYPRGIVTEQNSHGTQVAWNRIQGFHWGIEVGADGGTFASNTIWDADYAVYVVDNGTFPGSTSYDETIYNTTYENVAIGGIRLPAGFRGNVADLTPAIRSSDMTATTLSIAGTATRISFSWSGSLVNLSLTVDGLVLFDTVGTSESQDLLATWSGSITDFEVMRFQAGGVAFQLESSTPVSFSGSGFAPGRTFSLNRTDGGPTTTVLSASSSPSGTLAVTIPAASVPTVFFLETEGVTDSFAAMSAPAVLGTLGTNGWYVSPVNVTFNATSPSGASVSIAYRLDGGSWTPYAGPFTVGEGDHTLQWQASDDSGHHGLIQTLRLPIDLTGPVVTGLSPSAPVAYPDGPVSWTGYDNVSGIARYEVSVDGGPFQSVGTATSFRQLWNSGPHTVQVRAFDNAGHEAVAATSFTVDSVGVALSGAYQLLPISFPIIALALLGMSFVVLRRAHQRERMRVHPAETDELDPDDLDARGQRPP
jgi:hypothetical protein